MVRAGRVLAVEDKNDRVMQMCTHIRETEERISTAAAGHANAEALENSEALRRDRLIAISRMEAF